MKKINFVLLKDIITIDNYKRIFDKLEITFKIKNKNWIINYMYNNIKLDEKAKLIKFINKYNSEYNTFFSKFKDDNKIYKLLFYFLNNYKVNENFIYVLKEILLKKIQEKIKIDLVIQALFNIFNNNLENKIDFYNIYELIYFLYVDVKKEFLSNKHKEKIQLLTKKVNDYVFNYCNSPFVLFDFFIISLNKKDMIEEVVNKIITMKNYIFHSHVGYMLEKMFENVNDKELRKKLIFKFVEDDKSGEIIYCLFRDVKTSFFIDYIEILFQKLFEIDKNCFYLIKFFDVCFLKNFIEDNKKRMEYYEKIYNAIYNNDKNGKILYELLYLECFDNINEDINNDNKGEKLVSNLTYDKVLLDIIKKINIDDTILASKLKDYVRNYVYYFTNETIRKFNNEMDLIFENAADEEDEEYDENNEEE